MSPSTPAGHLETTTKNPLTHTDTRVHIDTDVYLVKVGYYNITVLLLLVNQDVSRPTFFFFFNRYITPDTSSLGLFPHQKFKLSPYK